MIYLLSVINAWLLDIRISTCLNKYIFINVAYNAAQIFCAHKDSSGRASCIDTYIHIQ